MSRQLDAAIAEALGYEVVWVEECSLEFIESTKHNVPVINYVDEDDYEYITSYSTDGNAMLRLDREMQKRGYYLTIMNPHFLNVLTGRVVEFVAIYQTLEQLSQYEYKECQAVVNFKGTETGKNEPLARALAAYKALTGKWMGG